ncbi:class I poly(R)-hydroxyalkanoic acid synthase [Bordetella genomosp. 8]|uniref:Class I poly(R)-hydroxyalkanoic acid synthase n=1 Tax=Bordetella genomosp. 8 TaxID=1416806 RepID=A0A1W6YNX9_9BORD|nr:class I poly(R)-hydroxyalkanoic acid synthase [Bordetella genomosp. 8]ARP82731.1 class I poly(R)-hydroxyalkanoic acid synthase [Bordetella genomosp. 8]
MTAHPSAAWPVPVGVAPDVLAQIQADFSRDWQRLADDARAGRLEPPTDKRFASEAWRRSPHHLAMAHAYLLSARAMQRMVDAAGVSEPLRDRLRFSIMQWLDAIAPSNFLALNPDAQESIVASAGKALDAGLSNLLDDVRKGRITQTDESQFEIGVNVAVTPGQVVFENALFQLIQYTPSTPVVHERPLVIVPPNINKFYILDLQPANSFVRHAVDAGYTVFMMSWRNPVPADDDGVDRAQWADYLENAVLPALRVAGEITGQPQVNALGFCVGGTLLASALALAHARGERPVAALTLLTALLDFRDTGVLNVFVDETHALLRERQLGGGGLMSGRELATTFAFLRPNELVWNYVVDNYLKGRKPPAFDLLFWNADSTNLPGPFFAWYFRNTYLENNLKVPGRCAVGEVPLDLTTLDMPAYIFGSREDHIVPWTSAYASTQLLRGTQRFVLGASGHIAGVINPPAKQRRSYWTTDAQAGSRKNGNGHSALPGDPSSWLARAQEHPGSWWPDWAAWLAGHSGRKIKAPSRAGSSTYPPIEPAPGRYVKVRAT